MGLDKKGEFNSLFPTSITKIGEDGGEEDRLQKESKIKEILFGSILGDGKVELPPRGKNARFGLIQAGFRRDYLLSVLDDLKEICTGAYQEYGYYDKRTGETYKSIRFWSRALPIVTGLYREFYVGKVKRVPLDLSLLTPLALAHLIMQDGSCHKRWGGIVLCTDGFTREDVTRLKIYLENRYKIRCSIQTDRGKYHRISIGVKSVEILKNKILPYMHKSMLYKLGE